MKQRALIISCEHAVNTVPKAYQSLFAPFHELLNSHRGIDFGALTIAEHLKQASSSPLILATATRLLIDCNRSTHHSSCFSEATRSLSFLEKQQLIEDYYLPFRQQILNFIKNAITEGLAVCHLSIHSFTPVMNALVRNADIGLLYDPKRQTEKIFARQWKKALNQLQPEYKVRMNYPYKGTADGLTTALRKQFTEAQYIGIEVESNQELTQHPPSLERLKNTLANSCPIEALQSHLRANEPQLAAIKFFIHKT